MSVSQLCVCHPSRLQKAFEPLSKKKDCAQILATNSDGVLGIDFSRSESDPLIRLLSLHLYIPKTKCEGLVGGLGDFLVLCYGYSASAGRQINQ
jgi:hypothetical protein